MEYAKFSTKNSNALLSSFPIQMPKFSTSCHCIGDALMAQERQNLNPRIISAIPPPKQWLHRFLYFFSVRDIFHGPATAP